MPRLRRRFCRRSNQEETQEKEVGKATSKESGKMRDDEQITERFIERAAIMEHDAGLSRIEATTKCFELCCKWCVRIGRQVPKAIVDDFERVKEVK